MNLKRLLFLLTAVLAGVVVGRRWLIARWLKLSPPRNGVAVQRNIPIPMRDGIVLMTDLYRPAAPGTQPTVLIRSSYGRGFDALPTGLGLVFLAQRIAERGYNVVVQTTRGQFDSGGAFVPYVHEQKDGLDTMQWIAQQSWFNGKLGTWGPSYLGVVQWALAGKAPDFLKAMVPITTATQVSSLQFPDDAFALETSLRWATAVAATADAHRNGEALGRGRRQTNHLERALRHLPLLTADAAATGGPVAFYRTWLENPPWDDTAGFWTHADHQQEIAQTRAAVHFVTGWYDIWVRELLADYQTLKAVGHTPYLTIGPWPHISAGVLAAGLRDGLIWLDAHLQGDRSHLRDKPVRVYVLGAESWRELPDWPPPTDELRYFLQPEGRLATAPASVPPGPTTTAGYRYDPADPTPILGGTQFNSNAGRQDQAAIEARTDVLVYTSDPLTEGLEIMGPVRLELFVRSSVDHTDFVGRLCDVDPHGRSVNVCDGLFRVAPGKGEPQPDGSLRIEIDMWATACYFAPGHAIRVQVCSAAHPRWSRNTGSGEPLATATRLVPAEQTLFHDARHPAALVLPQVTP